MLVNVGHPESGDRLEGVLSETMDAAFDTVLRDPVEDTNTVLIGTNARGAGAERMRAAAATIHPDLRDRALDVADRVAPRLDGGSVYTDDKAPVEWLIDASIVEVAASGER